MELPHSHQQQLDGIQTVGKVDLSGIAAALDLCRRSTFVTPSMRTTRRNNFGCTAGEEIHHPTIYALKNVLFKGRLEFQEMTEIEGKLTF